MKKIIAISVMLALVATGAVFAQPTVSGAIETRVNLVGGDNIDDSPLWTGTGSGVGEPIGTAWIQVSGANDAGTFGGTFRLRGQDIARSPYRFHKAYTWWRPLPQLRVFFGVDADGMFSTGDALFDWAFHNGSEGFMNVHNWDFWRTIFPGHWDGFGIALTATPIDGLTLNLVIPTGTVTGWPRHTLPVMDANHRTVDMLARLQLSGSYAIPDIGTIFFSYMGPGRWFGDIGEDLDPAPGVPAAGDPENYGQIGASFLLTALPGLRIQAGGSTWIPYDGNDQDILLGLGVHYTGGDFGVRFRSGVRLLQAADETLVTFNVMPWYRLGQTEIRLDIGMTQMVDAEEWGFWVNPYVRHSVAGGGYIQAGVIVHGGIQDTENPQSVGGGDTINFRVPVLFGISW